VSYHSVKVTKYNLVFELSHWLVQFQVPMTVFMNLVFLCAKLALYKKYTH